MLGKVWLKIGTHWDLHTHALIAASNAPCTDDIHDARQIVGEYAERHLARDLRQRLHQEVRRAHPHLERAEGMLNRLALATHGLRMPSRRAQLTMCLARSSISLVSFRMARPRLRRMLESDSGGEISQEQWIVAHFSG